MEYAAPSSENDEKLSSHTTCSQMAPLPLRVQTDDVKLLQLDNAIRWRNIEAIRELATSEGGLLTDDFRRQACSYCLVCR